MDLSYTKKLLIYEYLTSERRNDETWVVIRKSMDKHYPAHWFYDAFDTDGDDEFTVFRDDLEDMYDVVKSNGWIDYQKALLDRLYELASITSSDILDSGFLEILSNYNPSLYESYKDSCDHVDELKEMMRDFVENERAYLHVSLF